MFGLNDNNTSNQYSNAAQTNGSDASAMSTTPSVDNAPPAPIAPQPVAPPPAAIPSDTQAPNPINDGAASVPSLSAHSSPPSSPDISAVNLENAYIANDPPTAAGPSNDATPKPTAASLLNGSHGDDLLKLKQQALQSLAPLVDHLEQDPVEKFKTTMMMIQASDNADLIPEAYEAANKIPDEKVRAQALLDVVNEINYFTQHGNPTDAPQ
jgi:hypothetical protein